MGCPILVDSANIELIGQTVLHGFGDHRVVHGHIVGVVALHQAVIGWGVFRAVELQQTEHQWQPGSFPGGYIELPGTDLCYLMGFVEPPIGFRLKEALLAQFHHLTDLAGKRPQSSGLRFRQCHRLAGNDADRSQCGDSIRVCSGIRLRPTYRHKNR